MLLVGDVGGTKTALAVIAPEQGARTPVIEETISSKMFPSLTALVKDFISRVGVQIDGAVFGVAGPVLGGAAFVTNLGWTVDEREMMKSLGLRMVRLLNDLTAIAVSVPYLEPTDFYELYAGEVDPAGPIGVIAPGTGLGEAFLTWDGDRYIAHSSEGGHCDYAPTSELELGLLEYLLDEFEHVSYERVCSGIGIPNIYAYLKSCGDLDEPSWLALRLEGAVDPTPVIVDAAQDADTPCEICSATLKTFVSILGAESGNLALRLLATGGIYLGGGIPPRILSVLRDGEFLRAMHNKGRVNPILKKIPVRVIINPNAALLGAAYHGLQLLEEGL